MSSVSPTSFNSNATCSVSQNSAKGDKLWHARQRDRESLALIHNLMAFRALVLQPSARGTDSTSPHLLYSTESWRGWHRCPRTRAPPAPTRLAALSRPPLGFPCSRGTSLLCPTRCRSTSGPERNILAIRLGTAVGYSELSDGGHLSGKYWDLLVLQVS